MTVDGDGGLRGNCHNWFVVYETGFKFHTQIIVKKEFRSFTIGRNVFTGGSDESCWDGYWDWGSA